MRTKQRTVVSAERSDLDGVERLVRSGRYQTVSEFVRQAIAEKLQREDAAALAEEVERYVAAGHASSDDDDLVHAQALPGVPRRRRRQRAKR